MNLDKSANNIIETLQKSKTYVGMVLQPLAKELEEKKELVIKKFDYLRTYVTHEVTQKYISLLEEKISKIENIAQKINASKDILNDVIGNRSEYQNIVVIHVKYIICILVSRITSNLHSL